MAEFSSPLLGETFTLTHSVTPTTFTISWGNIKAYLYNLTILEGYIYAESPIARPPTSTGHTFTNLKPYTRYTVTVTPIALNGTKEGHMAVTEVLPAPGLFQFFIYPHGFSP